LKRIIQSELVDLFNQNKDIHITFKEVKGMMSKQGNNHSGKGINDNLFILASLGFLSYDSRKFSLSPNASKADLTTKVTKDMLPKFTRPHKQKSSDPAQQPKPNLRCDRCHREFKLGEIPYIRSFANMIQLRLCKNCYVPKIPCV
jgi:hypothetical protein